MILIQPAYYDAFRCKANLCRDTCCKGWEIRIDEKAMQKYKSHKGKLQQKFLNCIKKVRGGGIVKREKDGRCPFLDESGLCEIYKEMGKDALSDICAEHPRFFDDCDEIHIEGLGLCCEEATRLILSPSVANTVIYPVTAPRDPEMQAILSACKERTDHPENLLIGIQKTEVLRNADRLSEWMDILLKNEIRSEEWKELLISAKENLPNIISRVNINEMDFIFFERLIAYFALRHIFNARFFETAEEGIRAIDGFITFSVVILSSILADMRLRKIPVSDNTKANLAKLFSQEVEYDSELSEKLETPAFLE